MTYSFLNRFCGALVGSYLGETLILHQSGIHPKTKNWTKIGVDNSESLLFGQDQNTQTINNLSRLNNLSSSEVAIMSLARLLLCSESSDLLKEEVGQIADYSAKIRENILLWGHALSLACCEQKLTSQFIDKIVLIASSEMGSNQSLLLEIKKSLDRNTSLQAVTEALPRQNEFSPFALALYCFATTPEDFQLCIQRAIFANYQPRITAALAGAIAGAYNSTSGIPLTLRTHQDCRLDLDRLKQFARKLFAYWSGIYELKENCFSSTPAIASPNQIQSRSFFKTISQK
ncbi:MAG: ADP-ribosylglycohydrolase family protein [Prochloraceae cyanobacterium]|nr:ADP-ribosylglycohydrolase family protein [Prochloraceae cyanobacterium]